MSSSALACGVGALGAPASCAERESGKSIESREMDRALTIRAASEEEPLPDPSPGDVSPPAADTAASREPRWLLPLLVLFALGVRSFESVQRVAIFNDGPRFLKIAR